MFSGVVLFSVIFVEQDYQLPIPTVISANLKVNVFNFCLKGQTMTTSSLMMKMKMKSYRLWIRKNQVEGYYTHYFLL